MNKFSIFISSSDSYSDIWPVFFDLFRKYWPEYDGAIYLQTEEKEYTHDGLNIICTKIGKKKHFGATLRAGLDKVHDENILLIMIDYMFMGKVNHQKILGYYNFFATHNMDSLRFVEERFEHFNPTENPEIKECLPPAPNRFFSYQIAFWKKNKLRDITLPHETPWSAEWWGDKRAHVIPLKLYSINKNVDRPIPYDLKGCLHRGKWVAEAVTFLRSINYKFDFAKRGFYNNEYNKRKTWLQLSWMLKRDGLKGSYWDLLRRKYLS